jgi:hypothetical protein
MLRHAAAEPGPSVFGYDPFGHLRIGKNALFAWIAARPDAIVIARALIIAAHLMCLAGLQLTSAHLLGSRWWGLLCAAMFGLNPTTASATAWLSASPYVLCMALLWLHVLAGHAALDRRQRLEPWKAYAFASAVGAFLAGLQHELGLLAPLVFLAYRRARVPELKSRDRATMFLAWGGSLIAAVVTVILRGAATKPSIAYRMAEHGAEALTLHAGRYFVLNVRLWLWEGGAFGVLRDDAPVGHSMEVMLGWVALLSALIAAAWLMRRDPPTAFGFAWVAFLLPMVNIVPLGTTPVAMHYLYLPGAGFAFLAVRGGQQLKRILGRHFPALRAAPAVLLLAVLVGWQPEHVRAVERWGDDILLYEASIASQPYALEVRTNLAAALLRRNRLPEAEALLEAALAQNPRDPLLVKNRFEVLRRMGKAQQALDWLERHPDVLGPEFLYRKAQLQELVGQHAAAIETYARAAEAARNDDERFWAALHHARLLLQSGRSSEGRSALRSLVETYPGRPELQALRTGQAPTAKP